MNASGRRSMVYEEGYLDEMPLEPTDPVDKRKKPEAVVPVFVGQIFKSEILGHITMFGAPTRLVVILGVLTQIERIGTKLVYHVRDDTGSIKCIKWLEEGKEDSDPGMKLDTYIKVCGVLRVEDSQPCVLILNCTRMQGLNELTSHLLEILYVAIMGHKERQKDQNDNETLGSLKSPNETNKQAVSRTCWKDGPSNHYGLTQYQLIVYSIIKHKNEHEKGASKTEILFKVPAPVKENVNSILEFLLHEEHIYNTCSEEYFKAR